MEIHSNEDGRVHPTAKKKTAKPAEMIDEEKPVEEQRRRAWPQAAPAVDGLVPNRKIDPEMPDVTGREHIVRNIFTSWIGYSIYFVAGFVMPRMIDGKLGQDALGVWDFGWSIVSYFGLSQLGITQSIDRYVAKYRAIDDSFALNRSVSSVLLFQCFSTALVMGVTALLSANIQDLFGSRLGENVNDAQWIIILLGGSVAITQALNIFDGITTGCHRWDIHNGLNSGFYAMSVIMMITSLLAGGGLKSLAAINFITTSMEKVARTIIAFKICPELRISLKQAKLSVIREQLFFGSKLLAPNLADLFFRQTINVMIVSSFGVGALAIFSRPLALIKHSSNLVSKFANVLMPITSSLTAINKQDELKQFFLKAVSSGALITIPCVAFLSIFGGPLLAVWMGKSYADSILMAVLAVGSLPWMMQVPIFTMLIGLDKHGKAGIAKMLGLCVSMGLVVLNFKVFDLGLIGCAAAICVPSMIIDGIFMPLYATKHLSIPLRAVIINTAIRPLLLNLPLILVLAVVRWLFLDEISFGLFLGSAGGAVIGATIYWLWVVPERLKGTLRVLFCTIWHRMTQSVYLRRVGSLETTLSNHEGEEQSAPTRSCSADR